MPGKEETKLYSFADNITIYIDRRINQEFLELINICTKFTRYKVNK